MDGLQADTPPSDRPNLLKRILLAIGDTSRDSQLEDGKGIISNVNEYAYLRVRITKDGNHEPEINDRINRRRAAITKLNSILWDRDVTPQNKDSYLSCNS